MAAFLSAPAAFAHISLEQGGTHLSRYGDSYLKEGPCGKAGGTRGTHIYTYAPGSTITVSFVETVPHPSYFRFAFQANGDSEFKEPASIKPIDPSRPCPIDSGDHCGASDFYNTPNVLPMMDNLDPHLAGSSKTWTYQVTLPNVECDNCTLQLIQVMEDNQFHGDYDPTPGVGVEDIYHQCIDLVLQAGAPSGNDGGAGAGGTGGGGGGGAGGGGGTGGGGTGGSGGGTGGSGGTGSGGNGSTSKGGCAIAAHDTTATLAGLFFVALAALALRRRTR